MALPKVVFALGFFFVFTWTQAAIAIRDSKHPVPSYNNEYFSTNDPVPSISHRRHSPSTDNPRRATSSVPRDSEYASTHDPEPSVSYRKDFNSTPVPLDESSDNISRIGHTGRYTTARKGTGYPYPSSKRITGSSTGHSERYSSPLENTDYPYSSPKTATAGPTGYNGRYTTGEEGTEYPYTSPKTDTARPTGYYGRYTTGVEGTEYPYTSPKTGTAGPTGYNGRYTTGVEGTEYPSTSPKTGTARPTIDTRRPTTEGFICTTRPYEWNRKTTPGRDEYHPRTTTIGYICITRPYEPTYDPTPTPYKFWSNSDRIGGYSTTPVDRQTWNTDSVPWTRSTPSWRWTPGPVIYSTPRKKQITESKPNSVSDSVPGSLKNYFFIACETCNVFSRISVKNDSQNTPNRENMFQNMIDKTETKIDAALQNVFNGIDHLMPEE